jgi:tetrahydromethanopterin S-methyltransferase subunit A
MKRRRTKMKMSDKYLNDQLSKAQALLWGGSETENIEAHNIIAKLIKDKIEQVEL